MVKTCDEEKEEIAFYKTMCTILVVLIAGLIMALVMVFKMMQYQVARLC